MLFFRNFYSFLLFAGCSCLLWSCASVGSPTGGPKDLIPPKIFASQPKHQSTNFKGQKVVLVFDEYIQIQSLKNNLTITPNANTEYEYKHKANKLELIFNKPLQENTTYVFDFGGAITDVTEKNKPENLKLAFSTGSTIDSFFVAGKVVSLLNNKPSKATVCLYDIKDTLDIHKHKPLYYTKADSSGRFRITNVRRGKYRIYALTENKKADLIFNNNDEAIALKDSIIDLSVRDLVFLTKPLTLFSYDTKEFKFLKTSKSKHYNEVRANKNIASYQVTFADKQYDSLIYYSLERDIVRFYHPANTSTDSISLTLTAKDSAGNQASYQTKLKFEKSDKLKPNAFEYREVPKVGSLFNPPVKAKKLTLQVKFNKPVKEVLFDSMFFKIDKSKNKRAINPQTISFNFDRTELSLTDTFTVKDEFAWHWQKAAFISIENDSSKKRDAIIYNIAKAETFATISGVVQGSYPSFTIQLLNDQFMVEQELVNTKEFKFSFVGAGKKRIRVLIDTNNDGVWSAGDFKKRLQAEPVYFFPEIIEAKPNWEYEDNVIDLDEIDKQ